MIIYTLYYIISPLLWILLNIISLFNAKINERRQNYLKFFEATKIKIKRTNKRIILFHAASNGELEQLKPIFRLLNREKYFILLSISSPSSVNHIPNKLVDSFCYQAFDFPWEVSKFFKEINITKYIITRHDIWPNHIIISKKYSVELFLINGNLPKKSKRLFPVIKSLYNYLFNHFDKIHTVSEKLGEQFKEIVNNKNKIIILGDSRVDEIIYRKENISSIELPQNILNSKNIIFGSIEEKDIEIIIKSLRVIHHKIKDKKINYIFVPHEPKENILNQLESYLLELNISSCRYTNMNDANEVNALLVDIVGILPDLYRYSTISYVGCGFNKGVHNVLEPAIYGNLISFGPNYHILNEAIEMVENNLAESINSAEELNTEIMKIMDANFIDQQSKLIMNYVYSKSTISKNLLREIQCV